MDRQKITGNVRIIGSSSVLDVSTTYLPSFTTSGSNADKICIQGKLSNPAILRAGGSIFTYSDPSNFGDATTSDVASGKTFTSTNDIKITGTASIVGLANISILNETSYDVQVEYFSGSDFNNLGLSTGNPTSISINQGSILVIYGYGSINNDGSTIPLIEWMLDGTDGICVFQVPADTISSTVFLVDF